MNSFRFQPPFHVVGNTIYDASGREVRLWGVNYYVPFNHNYYNLEELGLDHFTAIDKDIRHFKLLGVEMLRLHLFDRELTDRYGNLVENKHLKVLDYLIDRCYENGIFLMIAPMVWYNTIENQIMLEKLYAYWYLGSADNMGFANFHSCDSMLWKQEAIDCQKRYFHALFQHRNAFSGKTMNEYSNIVVMELFNEPLFPNPKLLEHDLEITPQTMGAAQYARGEERLMFVRLWENFKAEHPDLDSETCFLRFRQQIVMHYFQEMWSILDQYFGNQVLHAQFASFSGSVPPELSAVFDAAPIDVNSVGIYLKAASSFDAINSDFSNHLALADAWSQGFTKIEESKRPHVAYEFDSCGTVHGYPLAALGVTMLRHHFQIVNYFTYTPADVAAWNPGWLVHFLNLEHTPARAAGFAIAGEIFRTQTENLTWTMTEKQWQGENFSIDREKDLVTYTTPDFFGFSGDTDQKPVAIASLRRIIGRGHSTVAESSGNGCYFLTRTAENQWHLSIFPEHTFLSDPTRGRTYRCMANRYVNCLKEPPVSQLSARKINFRLLPWTIISCISDQGESFPVENGLARLMPGNYLLTTTSPA